MSTTAYDDQFEPDPNVQRKPENFDMSLTLDIDNNLADQIVRKWLKQHLLYAQESYDKALIHEDRADAAVDMLAMRHLLKYVGEGE
jgi:hypothetical protein